MAVKEYTRLLFAVLASPPNVVAIFHEARQRWVEGIRERNREQPGWQRGTYDGPDSIRALAQHVDDVAVERNVAAEVRQAAKQIFEKVAGPWGQ